MDDIFQKDLSGEMVSPEEPGYDKLINAIWDTHYLARCDHWVWFDCGSKQCSNA